MGRVNVHCPVNNNYDFLSLNDVWHGKLEHLVYKVSKKKILVKTDC